jgi:hypothetical protein
LLPTTLNLRDKIRVFKITPEEEETLENIANMPIDKFFELRKTTARQFYKRLYGFYYLNTSLLSEEQVVALLKEFNPYMINEYFCDFLTGSEWRGFQCKLDCLVKKIQPHVASEEMDNIVTMPSFEVAKILILEKTYLRLNAHPTIGHALRQFSEKSLNREEFDKVVFKPANLPQLREAICLLTKHICMNYENVAFEQLGDNILLWGDSSSLVKDVQGLKKNRKEKLTVAVKTRRDVCNRIPGIATEVKLLASLNLFNSAIDPMKHQTRGRTKYSDLKNRLATIISNLGIADHFDPYSATLNYMLDLLNKK